MFDSEHAYFEVASGRHEDHAKELLGNTQAIVTSDRWWAYTHLPLHRRQLCWAHLKRDFQAHADGLAAEKQFGEAGLALCERVFWAWEVYQHAGERRELQRTLRSLQRRYKPIIRSFATKSARNRRCRGMAKNLLKAWPALWTFAAHDKVQPTNNHAERGLRSAVIYRKLSLASQSEEGEQRIGRLLSAHTTCRLQHRSLFAYLTDAINAHARGDPVPLPHLNNDQLNAYGFFLKGCWSTGSSFRVLTKSLYVGRMGRSLNGNTGQDRVKRCRWPVVTTPGELTGLDGMRRCR
jgi:transposase